MVCGTWLAILVAGLMRTTSRAGWTKERLLFCFCPRPYERAVPTIPVRHCLCLPRPAPHRNHAGSKPASLLRFWWERRRFARELPWIADEVLEDCGLTSDEARRLCRRPFWRA